MGLIVELISIAQSFFQQQILIAVELALITVYLRYAVSVTRKRATSFNALVVGVNEKP